MIADAVSSRGTSGPSLDLRVLPASAAAKLANSFKTPQHSLVRIRTHTWSRFVHVLAVHARLSDGSCSGVDYEDECRARE